jgi:hypothetical protein
MSGLNHDTFQRSLSPMGALRFQNLFKEQEGNSHSIDSAPSCRALGLNKF